MYTRAVRGHIDAQAGGRLIELKNYDWSKYSSYGGLANRFSDQAAKYLQLIGQQLNGHVVESLEFVFSNKPPEVVERALKALDVIVSWIK